MPIKRAPTPWGQMQQAALWVAALSIAYFAWRSYAVWGAYVG